MCIYSLNAQLLINMVFSYACSNLNYSIDCIGIISIWYTCISINTEDDHMLPDFVTRAELIDYFLCFNDAYL